MIDKTKWYVITVKEYTASGTTEVIASFVTKREAQRWASLRSSSHLGGRSLHVIRKQVSQ